MGGRGVGEVVRFGCYDVRGRELLRGLLIVKDVLWWGCAFGWKILLYALALRICISLIIICSRGVFMVVYYLASIYVGLTCLH